MPKVSENQWPITRGSTATGIRDGFLVLHASGEYEFATVGPADAYWGITGGEAVVVENLIDREFEILMTDGGEEASLYRLP